MYQKIINAYGEVGVASGKTVIVHSDLARLRGFESAEKKDILEAHYRALLELLGPDGTLVVHTGSQNLCNTDQVFDVDKTPSWNVGLFSEYVRQQNNTLRSFHPFISFGATGRLAAEITQNVSRNAWGPETPKARLVELDALCVSVGAHPRLTCSAVHHAEQMMGVPYRYTKEFMHPVKRGDEVVIEPFYTYVCYLDCDITRNRNKKIFEKFSNDYKVNKAKLGKGEVASYSMKDFFNSAVRSIKDDIYVWLEQPPKTRPYQN
ncbi:MAG: AAC(3) family N-acetyltransferase [Rhodospirillales bacterium]|nr:AAC(3) family N-acetyltransferase [Rhodospirillales bacterium]